MVLVSHSHKFVFLKTRKTAGTSVEMLLEPLCAPPEHAVTEKCSALVCEQGIIGARLIPTAQRDRQSSQWYNHMPAAKVKKSLGADTFENYLIITTVRNPFARLVSQFHYGLARNQKRVLPRLAKHIFGPPEPTQRQTVARFRKWLNRGKWKADTDIVFIKEDFVPQVLLRMEHLSADLKALAKRLGCKIDLGDLPTAKKSARTTGKIPTAAYYSEREISLVRQREAWAFERAGYPENPSQES